MRRRATRWWLLAVLAGALASVPARAQNLLTNPDFDNGSSGWAVAQSGQVLVQWDGTLGYPALGSEWVFISDPASGAWGGVIQCLPVVGGRRYSMRASRFMAPGQADTATLTFSQFFAAAGCTGPGLGTLPSATMTWHTNGGWAPSVRSTAVAPAGAQSAWAWFRLDKLAAGGSVLGGFDRTFFGQPVKGDMDGFGDTDLILHSVSVPSRHEVWLMSGVTRLSKVLVTPDVSGGGLLVGVDDFTDDGIQDLVFWNPVTAQVQFWAMDDSGTNRPGAPLDLLGASPLPTAWRIAATADFNHDGRPDLLWRSAISEQLVVWLMNGVTKTGSLTPSPSQAIDANWAVVGARDFNGDANTDLLWYNSTSGKIVFWFMDANVARITGQFASPANAGNNNWKVVAAGDYGTGSGGQSGTVDIVWRNETSGKLVVWYMNQAGTRTNGTFTSPDAPDNPLDWNVVGPK